MSEKLLNESVAEQVRQVFGQLKQPVQILFFGSQTACEYCDDTRQLLQEVIDLSDQLGLSVHDLDEEAGLAAQYKVDKAPGFVLAAKDGETLTDYGVRYAGIPAGHEFSSLIHDLVLVSSRDSGLDPKTRDVLRQLTEPVHLQVFVTPT